MEANPFIYNLSEKIEYSKAGQFLETASIELIGPNMSVFDLTVELSQLVMRATLDAQDLAERFGDDNRDRSNQDVDSNAIRMILLSSKSVKFSEIADVTKKLFLKVGTFDGEVKLKEAILNRLKIQDYTNMVCGYIANFIFPSLFSSEGD